MDDWRMGVTLFANAYGWRPDARRLSWGSLVRSLTTFRGPAEYRPGVVGEKFDASAKRSPKTLNPMWAPVVLVEGAQRRRAANTESVTAIVLDFDGGLSPEEARAPWMDYRHIVHTSYSHTAEVPKFRVVVPLKRPVAAGAWRRVWEWAVSLSPGADPKCKDPMRGYFVPVARGPYWAEVTDGPLLTVRPEVLPPSSEELRPPPVARTRPPRAPAGDDDRVFLDTLRNDPDARTTVARTLGARIQPGPPAKACGMTCPKCGDASVWFHIDLTALRVAKCNHEKSCQWHGSLLKLLNGEP